LSTLFLEIPLRRQGGAKMALFFSQIPGKLPAVQPDSQSLQEARETVCNSGKQLLRSGLVSGTWGNISLRLNDDYMLITPSGRDYETLTPGEIVLVDIRDLSHDGNIKPSSESGLHAEIYKGRKEILAVIHTHSQNVCTVAATHREIPPLLDDMVQIIGPSVRVSDYALSGTEKLTKNVMKALAGRNAALLANHGAVCIGRDMQEAFFACEILEKSCRTFIETELIGGGVPLGAIQAGRIHQYFLEKYQKKGK
jgi:L-fuculose-phosphate aldolase